MTAKLLVRQGGGAADEVDIANLTLTPTARACPSSTTTPASSPWASAGSRAPPRWARSSTSTRTPTTPTSSGRTPASSWSRTALGPDSIIAWGRIEGGNDTRRRSTHHRRRRGRAQQHQASWTATCDLRGLPFATELGAAGRGPWDRLQALHAAKLDGCSSSTRPCTAATTNIGCRPLHQRPPGGCHRPGRPGRPRRTRRHRASRSDDGHHGAVGQGLGRHHPPRRRSTATSACWCRTSTT